MAWNAMLAETLILLSCAFCLVIVHGQECLSNPEDLGSLVGRAPIVLEGRVEEIRVQSEDSSLFDVVASVVTVFKGHVDGGRERIVVGPFGASGSSTTPICVGEARGVGEELVLFLDASGLAAAAEVGTLRHFRLVSNPLAAGPERRSMVQEHAMASLGNQHTELCSDSLYCLHGGTCYIMPALGRRFCKCTPEYQGIRCHEKLTRIGARKTNAEGPIGDYFFLIIIGSAAVFLVLVGVCILLVVFVRCRPPKEKTVTSQGIRIIKYRNVSSEPKNEYEGSQSNAEAQTDSTNIPSIAHNDRRQSNRNHSNGREAQTDSTNVPSIARHDRRQSNRSHSNGLEAQTDSTNIPSIAHHDRHQSNRSHSNGRGKFPTSVAPPAGPPDAGLHRVPGRRHGGTPGGRNTAPADSSKDAHASVSDSSFRGRLPPPYATNGVWVSRAVVADSNGSTLRGQRSNGVSVSRDSDLDSIPV